MSSADVSTQTDARSFNGEEVFAAAPDRTFAALTDPEILAQCIPDLVSSERVDERTLKCKVKPGFSFIRATLKMTVTFSDIDAAQRSTVIDITSKGIGTSMKVQCRMVVDEQGDGSSVQWNATISQLTGLIAAVSPALIRGAADKVIRDGWIALRKHLEQ